MAQCCKKYEGIVCACDGTPLFAYSSMVNDAPVFEYYNAVTGSLYTGPLCNDLYTESFVELDPFFNASPAATITNTDIANWNAKVEEAPNDGLLYGRQFNGTNYVWAQVTGGGGSGLPTGGTTGQILAKASNTNYDVTWIDNFTSQVKHEVKLSENIGIGKAVYITGASGTNMLVSKADNTTEATSSKTMGLMASTGVTNDIRYVITEGLLAGTGSDPLNTSTAVIGDPVWLGTNGDLLFGLANKPYAPIHLVYIGVVTRVSATVGEIFVHVQNGFELNEIHDVQLPTTNAGYTDKGILYRDKPNNLWKHATIATILGYTPYDASNPNNYQSGLDVTNTLVAYCSSFLTAGDLIGYATQSWVNSQGFLVANTPITGATKTKITYDSTGRVTAGADATTADIADSTNKRYVTDAHLTVIGNTSNTNTGDETNATILTKLGNDYTKVTKRVLGATFDKSTLAAGDSVDITIPETITITSWTIVAQQTGSIVIDIQSATYSNFPTLASIAGTALPTVSSNNKAQSSTLTGWTTTIPAGTVIRFHVSSVSGITKATITLMCNV